MGYSGVVETIDISFIPISMIVHSYVDRARLSMYSSSNLSFEINHSSAMSQQECKSLEAKGIIRIEELLAVAYSYTHIS